MHGTGHVHHEDVLPGRDLPSTHLPGRLNHKEEEFFVFSFPEKQPGLDLISRETVFQDEIPIAAAFFRRIQFNGTQSRAPEGCLYLVGRRVTLLLIGLTFTMAH